MVNVNDNLLKNISKNKYQLYFDNMQLFPSIGSSNLAYRALKLVPVHQKEGTRVTY